MLTNREAIYQIKNLAEQSQTSRDGWSDIWIYKELLKYRARIINQKLETNVRISQFNYQDINCVALVEADKSEYPSYIDINCKLYKSKHIFPKTIRLNSVYNPSNTRQYTVVDIDKVKYRKNTRFDYINKRSFAYLSDSGKGTHMYVVSTNPVLENVSVNGLFYDHLEAQTYPNCKGVLNFPCRSYYDYEFKLDENLFTTISEMMLQYFYKLKFGPQDQQNNHIPNV